MSVTMLPSGGFVNPFWRPSSGGSSEEDFTPSTQLETAAQLAKNPLSQENYLQYVNDQANKGKSWAIEWLLNYWASEDSAKTAREWTAQREDTAYQRLMADLQAAGVSPYILSGATPAVSSSAGKSYSGSSLTSSENNSKTNQRAGLTASLAAILALMGIIIKAALI